MVFKEITDGEEHFAVEALAGLHYRSKQRYGRAARIIVTTSHPLYPRVLGYIELATPLYMNKARTRMLDAPFRLDGLAWDRWDKDTTRRYINLLVRVARCVVYQEFRGMGLGQLLVTHAASFARSRWQMAGYKPLFLEISADMLKYVPFAERAGMLFVGETEGNLERVYRDMEYLTRNARRVRSREIVSEESSGIVDAQVSRMNRMLSLIKEQGLTRAEMLERLRTLSKRNSMRDFALFHDIVSLPKPTYMMGLSPAAHKFLCKRAAEVVPPNTSSLPISALEPLGGPICMRNVRVSFESAVRRTRRTHSIERAFGISTGKIETVVLHDLSVQIDPGEIVLVMGASGAGKTAFLQLLTGQVKKWNNVRVGGNIVLPDNALIGEFAAIRSDKPLVEVMPSKDVPSALYLMGLVGLSDAKIYLKRFQELSRGQQYRAMLATLIASRANLWLIDEFCANLDPVTANVVAQKLQSVARRLNATVVLAAPHCEEFVKSLKPDKVLQLSTSWDYRFVDGHDLIKSLDGNKRLVTKRNSGRRSL